MSIGFCHRGEPPVVLEKDQDSFFQIYLLMANEGHFGHFNLRHVLFGIRICAEFRTNGCKFNFISCLRALMRKNNVGVPNVRN